MRAFRVVAVLALLVGCEASAASPPEGGVDGAVLDDAALDGAVLDGGALDSAVLDGAARDAAPIERVDASAGCSRDDDCGAPLDPCESMRCVESMCVAYYDTRRCPVACEGAFDCDDGRRCTLDECVEGACAHTRVAGCTESGCDADGDGAGTGLCGSGPIDCDDRDPARAPAHAEICGNAIDDDCDFLWDIDDPGCVEHTTCATAGALVPPARVEGATLSPGPEGGCGGAQLWTLEVGARSDVTIEVELHDYALDPLRCAFCPMPTTPDVEWRVYLERTCGDPSSDVRGAEIGCFPYYRTEEGWYGSNGERFTARGLEAGTYTVEVQARATAIFEPRTVRYGLEVSVEPSAE